MSRPRTEPYNRVTTAIRLGPDLHARLHAAAAERDLSMNYLVTKAVEEFLERLIPPDELRLTRNGASLPPPPPPIGDARP